MIPYSRQKITNKDILAVKRVLKSNFLTQGKTVEIFEKKICKFVKAKFGVASSSATSSLHLSCLALGLKEKENLWTVANSFVASANCARYCGANVDFVDINPKTFNIDVIELEKKLKKTKKSELPKILVVVHFAGEPAEMKKIFKLKKKYKFKIIEDASHALGAKIYDSYIGSCKYSDLTVFSFHPVKPITTAEGGIITTNDKKLFIKLQMLRNHGITRNHNLYKNKNKYYWYYEQQLLGFNYRMNDIEAALGISQLNNLKKFNAERSRVVKWYKKSFKNLPIQFQLLSKQNLSTHHLCVVKFDLKKIRISYNKLFEKLRKKRIGVNLHYLPIYSQPYYQSIKKYPKLKNTEAYYKSVMSIPVFPGVQNKSLTLVSKTLRKLISTN